MVIRKDKQGANRIDRHTGFQIHVSGRKNEYADPQRTMSLRTFDEEVGGGLKEREGEFEAKPVNRRSRPTAEDVIQTSDEEVDDPQRTMFT